MSNDLLNSLLDANLDDLVDLPEFKPFPEGAHKAMIKLEIKEINKHPSIQMNIEGLETLELANPTDDKPIEKGHQTSTVYMLDNEMGQGKWKEIAKVLGAHFGVTNSRSIIEATKEGLEVVLVTKLRSNKEKTQTFTDIVQVAVA